MKIFVYGTLKRGFRNDHYLKTAQFIDSVVTADAVFRMVEYPSGQKPGSTYPALETGGQSRISGELYTITPAILKELDILEEINIRYIRKTIELENHGTAQAYISIDTEKPMTQAQNIVKTNNILTFTNRN